MRRPQNKESIVDSALAHCFRSPDPSSSLEYSFLSLRAPASHTGFISPIHRHRPASRTMKDPFEAAVEEQDSPPESPAPHQEEAGAAGPADDPDDYDGGGGPRAPPPRQASAPAALAAAAAKAKGRVQREQQEDEDDEEDQMEVDLEKLPTSTGDPDKLAKMKFVPDYGLAVHYSYIVKDIALLAVEIRWFFVLLVIH